MVTCGNMVGDSNCIIAGSEGEDLGDFDVSVDKIVLRDNVDAKLTAENTNFTPKETLVWMQQMLKTTQVIKMIII